MRHLLNYLPVLGGLIAVQAFAGIDRYPSGFLHLYSISVPLAEDNVDAFIHRHFATDRHVGGTWKFQGRLSDRRHVHSTFALYCGGRRVSGVYLKTHELHTGGVQFASSRWAEPCPGPAPTLRSARMWELRARSLWSKGGVLTPSRIDSEPIWWKDRSGKFVAAREVKMSGGSPFRIWHGVLDEKTGAVLEQRRVARRAAGDVYPSNPDSTALSPAVLNNLQAPGDALLGTYIYTRREISTSTTPVEVDPTADYSSTIHTDPADYDSACTSTSTTGCADASFDSVNVYYHLDTYRDKIETYLAGFGVSSLFTDEPLAILVNAFSVDLAGTGDSADNVNNAAYISVPCREDGSIPKCIVVLPPGESDTEQCGVVQLHPLAREANVIVHEYQHYVTDTITGMEAGSYEIANVGDLLHEGYSDYFGASHVTDLSGIDSSSVGAYGFQNCSYYVRDTSTLRPYANITQNADPHFAGLSWASGLWYLRSTYGLAVGDQLALKSLFFLSPSPSFAEAVEALVEADETLYAGIHVATIRALFYDSLTFIGGQSGLFRDSENKILEMGLRSCAGSNSKATSSFFSWFLSLVPVLVAGLARRRRAGRC